MINLKDIKSAKHISDPTEEKLNDLKLISQETDKEIVSTQGENTKDILRARSIERLDALNLNSATFDSKIGERDTSVTEELSEITNSTEKVISDSEKYTEDIEAFLSVAKGDDFIFFLDNCTRAVGRLNKLTDGRLFCAGKYITFWDIPLPALIDGRGMFYWHGGIMNFNVDLPSLKEGSTMFEGCKRITSFANNLPSLKNGSHMFYRSALTSFTASIPSLTNGDGMFGYCILGLNSVQNIASTINNLASHGKTGNITIGIAADLRDNDELDIALETIKNKGWIVTEQYN